MDAFWSEHNYLLYVGCLIGFTYFMFTFKVGLRELEKWQDKINKEILVIQERQVSLRENLPEKYVLVERYDINIREIKEILDRIADKLDCKVDKKEWNGNDRRK